MVEVKLKQGILSGFEEKIRYSQKSMFCFLGIPYAVPPVGPLRFQAPKPAPCWTGVLDASKDASICAQMDHTEAEEVSGQEDCLYLNVYSPQIPSQITDPKAVLIYIHGGAYHYGGSQKIKSSPDYFVEHDVIVVTINYRLNVLGFLNLGLPECPGNVGLKDQVMAIKWVNDNINEFGGNPDNITLFGESAGAGSIHTHTISPLSKGLFKRCIVQSGHMLTSWAVVKDTSKHAFALGKLCGYDGDDRAELLKVLKRASVEELVKGTAFLHIKEVEIYPTRIIGWTFFPSVESIKEGAFLADMPEVLMKSAEPVPMIIGLNNLEGIAVFKHASPRIIEAISGDPSLIELVKENFPVTEENVIRDIAEILRQYYFKDNEIGNGFLELVNLFSDYAFTSGFCKSFWHTLMPPLSNKVYNYYFSYDGSLNVINSSSVRSKLKFPPNLKGACHSDELNYMFFKSGLSEYKITENDRRIIKLFTTFWTNFAKSGNPNEPTPAVQWEPTSVTHPCYLHINEETRMETGRLLDERMELWERILPKYRKMY